MANWCYNHVSVFGNETNVNKVMDVFKSLETKCEALGEGVLPDEYLANVYDSRYMFGVSVISDNTLSFDSKWVPPIKELQWVADTYNVTIHVDIEELGCGIVGLIKLKPQQEKQEYLLDVDDFELVVEFEDEDGNEFYKFNGQEYDSLSEALSHVLTKKYGDVLDII